MTRYQGSLLILLLGTMVPGCGQDAAQTAASSRTDQIDLALEAAANYLIGLQEPDGAWRPDTYGAFKDGPSLTPLVLQALSRGADATPLAGRRAEKRQAALRKGTDYLVNLFQSASGVASAPRVVRSPLSGR